ncbi:MAG: DNA polymerase III subunit delta' [Cycloclasticus sp.]|nr:MAG: DNA polymerase III subunit delta' [Cycloclasticus sp.]
MNNQTTTVYPWLQKSWNQLRRYQQQNRLPSAIMLVGAKGLGLSEFAKIFAHSVFCLNKNNDGMACGSCSSCLLVQAGNYPDLFHVQPEEDKKSISIDAIRKLSASLALNNQFTTPRIVIIDSADVMLHQASNSLLKTLEEPSENTSLILIAHKLSRVPMTIRSRCQILSIKDINSQQTSSWLKAAGCVEAEEYLDLAGELPLLALDMWQMEALEKRNALRKDFVNLLDGKLDPLFFANQCKSLQEFPVLKWMASWLSDVVKCLHEANNIQSLVPNIDDGLKVVTKKLHLKQITDLLARLATVTDIESSQINQLLMLEEFSIHCYSLTTK